MHRLVQVEFELAVGAEEWEAHCQAFVPAMRAIPGLVWKLWLIDREAGAGGGLYLFRSRAEAEAYEQGAILAGLRASPAVRHVRVRSRAVADGLSAATFALGLPDEGGAHALAR